MNSHRHINGRGFRKKLLINYILLKEMWHSFRNTSTWRDPKSDSFGITKKWFRHGQSLYKPILMDVSMSSNVDCKINKKTKETAKSKFGLTFLCVKIRTTLLARRGFSAKHHLLLSFHMTFEFLSTNKFKGFLIPRDTFIDNLKPFYF